MKKEKQKIEKQKESKSKIATRIIAGILAALMVLSVCATVIYYLFYMFTAK